MIRSINVSSATLRHGIIHSPFRLVTKPSNGLRFCRVRPLSRPSRPSIILARLYSDEKSPKENIKPTELAKKVLQEAAKRENIYTIPNMLTFGRLLASPVIGYLVVTHQTSWALAVFGLSCVTDLLDGYIARKYNMQTVVGSVIDPMADKTLMMTLATCLAVSGDIPLYIATLILGRDFLLFLSALYYRYISLPPPKTFTRYWDFSLPSAEVRPTTISKYNTFLQMIYLGSSLVFPVLSQSITIETAQSIGMALKGLEYVVATTTILSGLSYVFSKDAVKILSKPNGKP
uniref:ARAD1C41426p n=1 Tax=Blastobotrys adeninivorans TaxID=409370 RepID=A0A060T4K6_BLAAD